MPELAISDLDEAVSGVAEHWESLRGGHVFLTGGTGFIGTWLIEVFVRANAMLELGASATILTRNPERFQAKAPHLTNLSCIRMFAGDIHSVRFPDLCFSHVIHAAADASRSTLEDEPLREFDTIVSGTRRVLEFCRQTGVRNLLFLSSGAVYGSQPQDMPRLAEDCGIATSTSPYGEAKRAAESLCMTHAAEGDLRISIARAFAFLGPHLPLDGPFAAGNFVWDAIKREPIAVRGDPRTVRAYLYAGDLAAWLWTMLLNPQASGVYNVGSDLPVSIAELAELFAAAAGVSIRFPGTEPSTPSRYVPCIDRARQQLGLEARVPLEDAIRRTLRWYLQPPIIN